VLAAPSSGHVHGEVMSGGASSAGLTLVIIAVEMGLALMATTLVARLRARRCTRDRACLPRGGADNHSTQSGRGHALKVARISSSTSSGASSGR
jgi:hypothetical protein